MNQEKYDYYVEKFKDFLAEVEVECSGADLLQENAKLKDEVKRLQVVTSNLERSSQGLKERLDGACEQIERDKDLRDDYVGEIQRLRKLYDQKHKENSQLSKRCNDLNIECDTAYEEISHLEDKVATTYEEKAKLTEELGRLKRDLDRKNLEIGELKIKLGQVPDPDADTAQKRPTLQEIYEDLERFFLGFRG